MRRYENILQIVNLTTLHHRRDELCRAYFAKRKRSAWSQTECAITKWSKCVMYLEVVQRVTNSKGEHKSLQTFLSSVVFGTLSKLYFNKQFNFTILFYFRISVMLSIL